MTLGGAMKYTLYALVAAAIAPTVIVTLRDNYRELISPRPRIGIVRISSKIMKAEPTLSACRAFLANPATHALVLEIDSPGGYAGTSQTIFHELRLLKKRHQKPIIAFVENMCASGGYYIASAADAIVASPVAMIGSIGVYIPNPSFEELLKEWHIGYDIIKSGTYKAEGDAFRHLTDEGRTMLQNLVNDTHQQFIKDVIDQRDKLSAATAHQWGDGQLFSGRQAYHQGLVDTLGSWSAVEEHITQETGTSGPFLWIRNDNRNVIERLFEQTQAHAAEHSQSLSHLTSAGRLHT